MSAPKRIKYLGTNLYSEKFKTLMKGIEDDTKNGKIFHACGLEELLKYPHY